MRYEDLFVGLLIIALLIVAAIRILSPKPAPHSTQPEGTLSGRGSLTSAPLELSPGFYRIDYQFEALTRLALLDSTGDNTLFITSGTGTQGFQITAAGRYRLRVEPADENASWSITYRQIRDRTED